MNTNHFDANGNRRRTAYDVGSRLVLPEKPLTIKLLGDSITHGCGPSSFREDGGLIIDRPGLRARRNPNGYCWANLFRDYMRDACGCTVVNNAILGTGMAAAVTYYDELVSDEDDIVLIMYGANDRHEFYVGDTPQRTRDEHMRAFLSQVSALRERLEADGKDYVFLSGPPDSLHNEAAHGKYDDEGNNYIRHFHMWDINNMLFADSRRNGYPFIPVYREMVDFFETSGENPVSYREWCEPAGCVHLNEAGSRLVCRIVVGGLGLAMPVSV